MIYKIFKYAYRIKACDKESENKEQNQLASNGNVSTIQPSPEITQTCEPNASGRLANQTNEQQTVAQAQHNVQSSHFQHL